MKFYVLTNSVEKVACETDFSYLKPHENGPAPHCPKCNRTIGMLTSLPPYNIELELWDKGFGDIAFGPNYHLLVSEKFKTLWQEQGLAGLEEFSPVSITKIIRHKKFNSNPPKYFLTYVQYGKAIIDQKASGFEWEKPPNCPLCQEGHIIKRWKSHILLPDTWDDLNIFRPIGLRSSIMADQTFKNFVEKFKMTNCWLIPAEKFAHDFYPWENKGATISEQNEK
jgi:hypothetical protein